jgi:hypothetical protein
MADSHDDIIGNIPISSGPETVRQEASTADTSSAPRESTGGKGGSRGIKPSSRWKKWLIVGLPVLLLASIFSILSLFPSLLTGGLSSFLSRRLDREVTIGQADISFFDQEMSFYNFIVGPDKQQPDDKIDPLASFAELHLKLDGQALLRGKLRVRSIVLRRPFFHLAQRRDGSSNLSEVLSRLQGDRTLPFRGIIRLLRDVLRWLTISDFTLEQGRIIVDDQTLDQTHAIEDISIHLPRQAPQAGSSGVTAIEAVPSISAIIDGGPVSLTGKTEITPTGQETALHMELKDTDLTRYFAYLPENPGYRLISGTGDFSFDFVLPGPTNNSAGPVISGTLHIRNLQLQSPEPADLTVQKIELKGLYSPANDLLSLRYVLLDQPSFPVSREKEERWSFPGQEIAEQLVKAEPSSLRLTIAEFSIRHGSISFTDLKVAGGYSSVLSDLSCSIKNIDSSASGQKSPFMLQISSSPPTALSAEGSLSLAPFSIEGLLVAEQLKLPGLVPYLSPAMSPFHLKKGVLEKFSGHFRYSGNSLGRPGQLEISKAEITANDLQLLDQDNSFFLPSLVLSGVDLDSSSRRLLVGRFEMNKASCSIQGEEVEDFLSNPPEPAGERIQENSSWQYALQEAFAEEISVRIVSREQLPKLMKMRQLQVVHLGSEEAHPARIAGILEFDPSGVLQFAGRLTPDPFSADLQIDLNNLPLQHLPALWSAWMQPSVLSGIVDIKGGLHLPQASFSGSASINDFSLTSEGKPLLTWRQAIANKTHFSLSPFALDIQSLSLDGSQLDWSIMGDKRSTLQSLLPKMKEVDRGAMTLKLEAININDARFDFSNHAISPPFLTTVSHIAGTVSGLQMTAGNRCHVSLSGSMQEAASATLNGDFGFFGKHQFSSFTAKVNNLFLPPFSSQIQDILGYEIEDGTLDMTTSFHLANDVLTADNELQLKNFRPGRQLNPISQLRLTLALLTSRDGLVHLSAPIKGKTSDPSFSYRQNFLHIFRNLLLKTAVSPFSLLNALIPEKRALDLDHISFPFGQDSLSETARQELSDIAKAVSLRPWLTLIIQGEADARADWQAIVAKKKQEMARKEMERLHSLSNQLSRQYGREEIILPDLQTESAGRHQQEITPSQRAEELNSLGRKRAEAVYSALIEQGVSPKRLWMKEKIAIIPPGVSGRTGNRVTFTLGTLQGSR